MAENIKHVVYRLNQFGLSKAKLLYLDVSSLYMALRGSAGVAFPW